MLPATGREFCIKIFNCPCCRISLSAAWRTFNCLYCRISLSALPGGPSTVSTAASACQLCLEDLQLPLLPHQPVSSAWRTINCPCCLINLSALPGGPSTVSTAASACQLPGESSASGQPGNQGDHQGTSQPWRGLREKSDLQEWLTPSFPGKRCHR